MEKGLISIIIPTFNRTSIIQETLDSFIAQTYTQWECILVDDGSDDGTQDVIKANVIKDNRFKFYQRPPDRFKGANACRNYGLEMSQGEFINWFDSDDLVDPHFLEMKLHLLREHPELDMAACYGELFFEDGRPNVSVKPHDDLTDNEIRNSILHDFCFYTNSPLWRKSALLEKGEKFDEEMYRAQEKDFHFRLLFKGINYKRYTEKPLFFKRADNDSITTTTKKNIKAKLSEFKLRNTQYTLINSSDNASKEMLIEYLFYRQAVNYYDLMSWSSASEERTLYRKEYFPKVLAMIQDTHMSKSFEYRLKLGNFLLSTFKKGYKFFYFPQFNYRSF